MQRLQTISWRKLLKQTLLVLAAVFLLSLSLAAGGWWHLAKGNFSSSSTLLKLASPVSLIASRVTLGQISLVETWYQAVWLGRWLSEWQLAAGGELAPQLETLDSEISTVTPHFQQLAIHFQRSWLLAVLVPNHQRIAEQLAAMEQFLVVTERLLTSDDRFLLLLQNTDELRATGGFIGSYAVLDFSLPNPFELEVRDIYDPSGVSFSLLSPAGQARYLSEGAGMKLHDANWSPDFPTSAQLILRYFANIQGDPQVYDGVVAVPLSVIEDLVAAVGGLYLPDQGRTITADEFAEVIRQDRQDFFPGSRQKQQSLQQVYTALWLRFTQLTAEEWRVLLGRLAVGQLTSELQFYAKQPTLQQQLEQLGLAGITQAYGPQQLFVFPVESNVGINKANRKVSRSLALALDDQHLLTVTTQFQNHYTVAERPAEQSTNPFYAAAGHLGYANYYRLLVRSDMRVRNITLNGQPLDSWDEEIVVSVGGVSYLQVGFLITLPEEERLTAQVQFSVPAAVAETFIIQKQVGLEYDEAIIACANGSIIRPLLARNLYQASCNQQVE